jgi:hypothetical protein
MSGRLPNWIRRASRNEKQRTRVRLLSLTCWALFVIGVLSAMAEEPTVPGKQADAHKAVSMRDDKCDLGCACCHTCDRPTPENLCLPPCERGPDLYMQSQKGPDVVILDELQDAYLPVPFDHKGHADMAEMTQGCVLCHHYTPKGQQHPACKTCHDVAVEGTGIHKPGLKGAYHRQCLNCHKDWIDASDCGICHRRRTAGPGVRDAAKPPTDHVLGRIHPPITEPQTEFYRAETKEGAKSTVIFRHWEHVHGFDLRCVDCHHEDNCTRCHVKTNGEKPVRSVKEHHRPCLRCHKSDMDEATTKITGKCRRCHVQKGQPMPKPFDHANTGWPLSRYHEGNSCRDCHKTVPFVKQSTKCNDCHGDWDPDNFNHTVTGQILDDNHKEIDCADCHLGRQFDAPPKCDECHDEDDGISFPARRPGLPLLPSKRRAD